jgi:hypothetical protein
MIVTHTHLEYWKNHQRRPSWFDLIERKPKCLINVNHCVNAHAEIKVTDNELAASNLLNILRILRKRSKSLLKHLDEMSIDPGTVISPERRSAYCKKWAKRIRSTK